MHSQFSLSGRQNGYYRSLHYILYPEHSFSLVVNKLTLLHARLNVHLFLENKNDFVFCPDQSNFTIADGERMTVCIKESDIQNSVYLYEDQSNSLYGCYEKCK